MQREQAQELVEINELRKSLVTGRVDLCNRIIAEDCLYGEAPLIIYTTKEMPEQFQEGIVGILTGRMNESYKVPSFILTETEDGVLKGADVRILYI